jgi:hypothetical protein
MSGLTGYLLADGITDLSNVFMPIGSGGGSGGVVLSANNVFTGTNTFSNLTTINAGLALPSNGTATTRAQLGYTYVLICTAKVFVSNTSFVAATLPANTLVAGTYLVNVVYPLNLQWSGTAGAMSSFNLSLTTVAGQYSATSSLTNTLIYGPPFNAPNLTLYYSGCNFSTVILVENTSQVYYFNVKVVYTETATIQNVAISLGSLFFTRIA